MSYQRALVLRRGTQAMLREFDDQCSAEATGSDDRTGHEGMCCVGGGLMALRGTTRNLAMHFKEWAESQTSGELRILSFEFDAPVIGHEASVVPPRNAARSRSLNLYGCAVTVRNAKAATRR